MSPIRIKNGNVITPRALLKDADVLIEGAKIAAVGKAAKGRGALNIDAKDLFVAPGFIDTHIHGDPETILEHEVKYGTTAILPALSCDSLDRIYSKIDEIKAFVADDPLGKAILGVRLEGPFINKRRAGAQDKRYILKPDKRGLTSFINLFKKGVRPFLKIITIAPELEGTKPLLGVLKKNGIIASIGHSDATYEEALKGFDSGITHATHLFNAMSGFDDGERGVATAALVDERIYAEGILDLVHFHPKLFRLLVKVKDISKIILITDSVRAEYGSSLRGPKGRSNLNKEIASPPSAARNDGHIYRFADGRIAGSALTMIQAVKNAVQAGRLSVIDAVRCATLNPARLLGIDSRKGAIAAGKDADIVVFDKNFNVKMTMINGRIVRCAG